MKERILEFLKIENRTSAQFAEEIGVQPSSISHIISGRNNPSLDFVMKMLTKYPSLSSDWLLFGRGQMYREPQLHDLFNINPGNNTGISDEVTAPGPEYDFQEVNKPSQKSSSSFEESNTGLKVNMTKRIVCFFNDGTFKEYFPGEEHL